MAEYLTNNTDLKKVADAIRTKGGTSAALAYPDEYVSAINAITTGTELKIVVSVTTGATVIATKDATDEMPIEKPLKLSFDRPFLYAICMPNGEPLFIGKQVSM